MITGSHNPGEYNGFKVCVGKSTVFGEDIQKIKNMILQGELVSGKGSLTQDLSIPDSYIEYVTKNVRNSLNLSIVVDSGNGMAGNIAPKLYRKLGCEVTELYSELNGEFPNHHPDPTVEKNLTALKDEVKKTKARVGIGFDGDADRIGIVDDQGRFVLGDEMMALIASSILKENRGAKIIGDVKCSDRMYEFVKQHGGKPIMWKTGHSLIKEKVKVEKAPFGGELSGHVFFADRNYGYDDALYAGLRVVEILGKTGKSVSDLLAGLPPSY
jgi:phosphomannomutase/phosphomannomutase/phosphoglucomutase